MAKVALKLREVGGQLLFDKPYHCSFCRGRYIRRLLINDWFRVRDIRSSRIQFKRATIRICITRVGDPEAESCVQLGLEKLLNLHKKGG